MKEEFREIHPVSMLYITIVEDDPAEAYLLSMALQETGMPVQILVFNDGAKALDYITGDGRECDLVLLDLNLPRLSGLEVLTRLKSQEEFRSIPVIVLSGSADPADVERCYQAGASSYVCKPTHLDAISTMARHLVTYWSKCAKIPAQRSVASPAPKYRIAGD